MFKSNSVRHLNNKADASKVANLPAKDFMNREVISIRAGDRIDMAIKALKIHKVSGLPIVDDKQHLLGLVTEYDLLLQAASRDLTSPVTFNSNITAITPETTLKQILLIFYKKHFRWMPVINELGELVGIVSRIDVLWRLTGDESC